MPRPQCQCTCGPLTLALHYNSKPQVFQQDALTFCRCARYHGPRPVNRPNHVWVSNHTSMIDYIILTAYSPFAVIMQLHPGWVGFLQTKVLNCLGCLWFNRTEVRP